MLAKPTQPDSSIIDVAGIGVGPFNLSVAALLQQVKGLSARFFESREQFAWHPGLLLPDTHMQTMFLKDLVTAVAPHSTYSFLSYLVKRKKFYRFLSAELSCISRAEFSDYLSWAAQQIPSVQFATDVENISFTNSQFEVETSKGVYYAKNLCLGTGKRPYIPDCAQPYLGKQVIHAANIGLTSHDFSGKRVMIIGGGQSGADIFLNALNGYWGKPSVLNWLSRRANYQPLDEAAFSNEYFTPDYVDSFYKLNYQVKEREIDNQKLTSDGITQDCLLTIYRTLYHRFDVLCEPRWVNLLPHREMTEVSQADNIYQVQATNGLTQETEYYDADVIILATGFTTPTLNCLAGLRSRLMLDEKGRYSLNEHFTVDWDGPSENRIFAVNAGLHSHGIAEPQLSLMAWRSAKIINHLCQQEVFDLDSSDGLISWLQPLTQNQPLLQQAI
ncbi:SidA/IucD/PvdA family monooxygenase [Endozoicomonas sp. SM1973]|uniref:SidA/IucD/PvdA family monooxygenase n=1 Tax=Spartinivicinus marinus TaxID=2994442 RepID=A0A853I7Z7_9GAMM|nr:SidA/IucD/PvdA family monooxygenase [Spartinivicinus marinus]MCX4028352.1 SidA/IucD/PvdA family monooxygenase [Spartinivicinus marinus]NYZ65687.1 SidA/IucD/PvdA family monooxygenase [Spartinivicinus marinus]